jgi:hypothetical protein
MDALQLRKRKSDNIALRSQTRMFSPSNASRVVAELLVPSDPLSVGAGLQVHDFDGLGNLPILVQTVACFLMATCHDMAIRYENRPIVGGGYEARGRGIRLALREKGKE